MRLGGEWNWLRVHPVSGLRISGIELAITINSGLISQLSKSVSKHEKNLFYFHMNNTIFHLFTKSTKKFCVLSTQQNTVSLSQALS